MIQPSADELLKSITPQEAREMLDALEKDACERSLAEFVRTFWHIVEPSTPLVWGWTMDAICEHLEAVTNGHITRLCINVPPGFSKSLLLNVFWPSWEWGPKHMPHLRYVSASYSQGLTVRDNIRFRRIITAQEYKKHWGDIFGPSEDQFTTINVANNKTGWKLATSVGGRGTGDRGNRFIIDDGNNVLEAESPAVMETTNLWIREVVPDRLNNIEKDAIINIQQRTAENDVTGTLLSLDLGYEHLMIPMEYDQDRHCETSIGWFDPRTTDGELAFPERFPLSTVDNLRKAKGAYAFCNPYEAPILMGDLSMKPIGEVKKGDKVVGFNIGNDHHRAQLQIAEVISISVSKQPVVKMTFASGETIRCTPDHKWWTARNDKTHKPYAPARIGSTLSRVCPSSLPPIDSLGDHRLAGWLAGFFDGEGSVTLTKRRQNDRTSAVVSFYQGDGTNLALCENLEIALKHFGFNWGLSLRDPVKKEDTHKLRHYWLKMTKEGRASRLPLYQRFLHIVQPIKWRERLIDSVVNGRLYTGSEKVVSIEPDGEETVYGLETTTGNYVVWGLASSNSGQYQQSPSPRGGGIIPVDSWQLWGDPQDPDNAFYKTFPPMDYVVAALDSAYTEKEENDYSALVIFGLYQDKHWMPKLMLMHAWHDRLKINDLVTKVLASCQKYGVDKILVEDKAAGHSVAQELRRLMRSGDFSVQMVTPKGDKVARAYSVQHMFSEGMIYAPWSRGDFKDWARLVIDELAVLPKGMHDDLADAAVYALKFFRDSNLALSREEQQSVYDRTLKPSGPEEPLYDV